jgi:hypothetical protein
MQLMRFPGLLAQGHDLRIIFRGWGRKGMGQVKGLSEIVAASKNGVQALGLGFWICVCR